MNFIQRLKLCFAPSQNRYLAMADTTMLRFNDSIRSIREAADKRNAESETLEQLILDARDKVAANTEMKFPIDFEAYKQALGHELDILRVKFSSNAVNNLCMRLRLEPYNGRGGKY